MINYRIAKANAMAKKADWNAEEYTAKAKITWADSDYEYEFEVENEDFDSDFEEWVEANAEDLAREEAENNGTEFEELVGIDYSCENYDDDAAFDREYNAWAEYEWECRTGR